MPASQRVHGFDISLPRAATRWHPFTWPLGRHTIDWALLGARRIIVISLSDGRPVSTLVKASVVSGLRYVENLPDAPRPQN